MCYIVQFSVDGDTLGSIIHNVTLFVLTEYLISVFICASSLNWLLLILRAEIIYAEIQKPYVTTSKMCLLYFYAQNLYL